MHAMKAYLPPLARLLMSKLELRRLRLAQRVTTIHLVPRT